MIARIEPDARIVGINVDSHTHTDHGHSHDHNGTSGDDENTGWRVVRMVLALVLTGAGIIFNETLHATQYQVAEYVVLLSAYLLVGGPVLLSAGRNILRGRLFDEMFLMSVATLGAIAIHELPEAVAVMLFIPSVSTYRTLLSVGRVDRYPL